MTEQEAYALGAERARNQSVDAASVDFPQGLDGLEGFYRQGIRDEQARQELLEHSVPVGPPVSAVPPDAIDRVMEAVKRSVKYLPGEAQHQFAALLTPESLWAMAIIFGVWAGLQFLPAGPLLDAVLALASGYVLLRVFSSLKDAVLLAVDAKTDAELERAAKSFAHVWVEIGIDALTAFVSSAIFRGLRAGIVKIRPPRSASAGAEAAEAAEGSSVARSESAARPRARDERLPRKEGRTVRPAAERPSRLRGAATALVPAAIVQVAPDAGAAGKAVLGSWGWALAGGGAALLLAVGIAAASRRG